ncbi:MAG: hypothetical protein LBH53_02470 [Puniceicoccales bacterium]|nr:hypothetical protein [Puniceicoccales bacterium]
MFFESKIDDLIPVSLSPAEKMDIFMAAIDGSNGHEIYDLCVASVKILIRSKLQEFPNAIALRAAIDRFATPLFDKSDSSKLMWVFANTMLHHAPHSEAAIVDEFVTDSGGINGAKIEEAMLRIVLHFCVEAPDSGQSCLFFCRLCSFLKDGSMQSMLYEIGEAARAVTPKMRTVLSGSATLPPPGIMRMALKALLLEVRQEHLTGSCAMVSVLNAIQNDRPEIFLAMLREMFLYDYVTLFARSSPDDPESQHNRVQVAISTRGSLSADAEPHVFLQRALIATIADGQQLGGYNKYINQLFLIATKLNLYANEHRFPQFGVEAHFDAKVRIGSSRISAIERFGAYVICFFLDGRPADFDDIEGQIKRMFASTAKGRDETIQIIRGAVTGGISGGTIFDVLRSMQPSRFAKKLCEINRCNVVKALNFFLSIMADSAATDKVKVLVSGDRHGYTLCPMLSFAVPEAIEAIRKTNTIESGIAEIMEWAQRNPGQPILFIDPNWEGYMGIGVRWCGSELVMCARKVDGSIVDLTDEDFEAWAHRTGGEEPYLRSFLWDLAAYFFEI